MPILIDGYNLLYAAQIVGPGAGPGSFHRARLALLAFVAEMVQPDELPHTTVVFDAANAPPGLPRTVRYHGVTAHFASDHDSADALLEELIEQQTAPRRLTVVSSDHRVQRAARRRRASFIDSDQWYAQVIDRRRQRDTAADAQEVKPRAPLTPAAVRHWLDAFGPIDVEAMMAELIDPPAPSPPDDPPEPPPLKPGLPPPRTLAQPLPPGSGHAPLDG